MRDIPHRRRQQAHKAFRIGLALLVILSLLIGIAAAQTADEPDPCPKGPPIRGESGAEAGGVETVVVNDLTGSIETSGLVALKEANGRYIENLNEPDELGAVAFTQGARIDSNLTQDYASVNDTIQNYSIGTVQDIPGATGTLGEPAIESGTEVLLNNSNATEESPKTLILLTDGEFSDQSQAEIAAQQARDSGIVIFVIGLGPDVNSQGLINIAGSEERYYEAGTANLTQIYENVSADVKELSQQGLRVETRDLYLPGETHPYTVTEIIEENGTIVETNDVTGSANITIVSAYNGTLFTVGSGTLTAVNDENVSDWARIDAAYNGSTGCTNAIVSQPTVENIELVPGIWRLNALIGDSTIFFILLATLAAVAMTRFTSSFGGIAVAQVVMAIGWLAGYVPWAFAAASVFIGLFIGLNLAANIDYSVGRFKP